MEYILTLLYAAIFAFVILNNSFFKTGTLHPKYLVIVFAIKILAGILLGYLYKKYFNGGDTFVFFDDASKLFEIFKNHPFDFLKIVSGLSNDPSLMVHYQKLGGWNNFEYFYNDSRTIVRINALIRIFSFGYYNVHVVFFSFLSLAGLNGLFKLFTAAAPEKQNGFFVTMFFIPSVLFWTSGILKEGILIFALGMFLYCFQKIINGKRNLKHLISFSLALIILIYLKIYVFAILLPGIIAYWWSTLSKYKNVGFKFGLTYLIYFIVLFNLKYINPNYNLSEIIYWKQHNTIQYAKFMNSGSYISIPTLEANTESILKHSPQAFLNVLIQPDWKNIHNPFSLLTAFENLLIIFSILFSIFFLKDLKDHQKPLFFLGCFFVLFLFILIGLTTPILGAMVRYKVPALTFLLSCLLLVFNKEKLVLMLKR
jgi:hypothetical protein